MQVSIGPENFGNYFDAVAQMNKFRERSDFTRAVENSKRLKSVCKTFSFLPLKEPFKLIMHDLELSPITFPPLLVLNRSADMPGRKLNHTMFNVTRITLRTNRCESNDDCKGGSFCLGNRCICPFNMIMKDGFCQRMFPFLRERGQSQFSSFS